MMYISKSLQDKIDTAMGGVKKNWIPFFTVDEKEETLSCRFLRLDSGEKAIWTERYGIKLKEIINPMTKENRIVSLIMNCCEDAMNYDSKVQP